MENQVGMELSHDLHNFLKVLEGRYLGWLSMGWKDITPLFTIIVPEP